MVKTSKITGSKLFSLLLAATIFFVSLAAPVSVEARSGVHADITTFEKNFSLSVAQKKYAIKKIDRIVSIITDSDMSDLEKYYRLALWENDHVTYDYDFWSGEYVFKYYRHQWDAYGALTDTSVCAGIAILYANLCHAADLPCKFVRTDPSVLDHTINYIPDINGNAYYVDVTEASFLMSENADGSFGDIIDKDFAYITNPCTDGSFEYEVRDEDDNGEYSNVSIVPTYIKDCFKKSYKEWFNEYAKHENTTKNFVSEYVEKGSGTPGVHYASYHDYPKQFSDSEKPGIWFLEDFYKNPEDIRSKIMGRVFDEQLIDISGIKDTYDCNSASELEAAISDGFVDLEYFPSSQNDEIVPEEEYLLENTDYTVSCKSFDKSKGEAVIAFTGIGEYTGTVLFPVKIKTESAVVKKAANPMKVKGKTATVKFNKLKKKPKTFKRAKVIKVSNAKGKLTYKYVTAKKGKKVFKKFFKINSKTGKVIVRKGLKKGTYKVKVKVKAAGNATYKASTWKTVIFKVRVK